MKKDPPRAVVSRATRDDDEDLRRLLRDTPMAGRIGVAFTREPDYFSAAEVEGEHVDVAIARDTASNNVVGFGTRAEKKCFLNGDEETIGYLSGLRLQPAYRNGMLVARGYQLMKQFHQERPVSLYITTIIEDNDLAKSVLTSGKAGLPAYRDLGLYHTLSIRPPRSLRPHVPDGINIRRGRVEDADEIANFLQAEGRHRQFYPVYQKAHLLNEGGLLRALSCQDLVLAFENERLVGTIALWQQKRFKQSIISGYNRQTAVVRPLYNLLASINGKPGLPRQGARINYLTLALLAVQDNDANIFEALLRCALFYAKQTRRLHSIMIGFHELDPLLAVAAKLPHIDYRSRLYGVFWEDGKDVFDKLDDRIPYLELGAL